MWLNADAAHAEQDRIGAVHTDAQRTQKGMCWMDVTTQFRLLWLGGLAVLYRVTCGTIRTHGPSPSQSRLSRGDCEVSRPAAQQRRPNGPKSRLVDTLTAADFAPLCAMTLSAPMHLRLPRVAHSTVALKASPEIWCSLFHRVGGSERTIPGRDPVIVRLTADRLVGNITSGIILSPKGKVYGPCHEMSEHGFHPRSQRHC